MTAALRLGAGYVVGVTALRTSDVLLASFPRSGSTLFRFVATHYALESAGDNSEVTFERLNRLAPELGRSWLIGRPSDAGPPRWIKTHRPYSRAFARPRALLLIRSPLDALASYHRYWTAREGSPLVEPGAFLRDARRGLPRWIRHTQSWSSRVDVTLRYAELRADPAGAVRGVMEALGVDVNPEAMTRAAERSSPEAVRALVRAGGLAGTDRLGAGAEFVADRPVGNGAAYFSAADRAWARRRLAEAGLESWGTG